MSDHEDQPTNSSEEDDVGPGGERSYGCIFCKRGFTTAQALGGHMNIHRKDRAKTRPFYSISNKLQEENSCYTGPRLYHPIFASYPPTYIQAPPPNRQEGPHTTYFSSTSTAPAPIYIENNHHQLEPITTSPSREEKTMSLSLQFARSHGEDNHSKRRIQDRNYDQEQELDLELRLGHDP